MQEQEKHTADLFGENKKEAEFDPVKLLFGESSSSHQNAAPLFGESVSPRPGTIPLFGESTPSQPETTSLFGDTSSSSEKTAKTVIEEPVLLSRDTVCTVPAAKPVAPVAEEPVPAVEKVAPVAEESVPAAKPVAPVAEEPVPAAKPVAPVAEEPVPAVEPVAPAADEPVPAVEPVAPVAEEPVPAVEQVAPAADEPVPAVEKVEPVTKPEKTIPENLESPRIIGDNESKPIETFKTYTPLVHRTVVPTLSVDKCSIGEFMADVRKQSGCSLEEVAESTRIRKFYIEAIEKDEFDKLPLGSFPAAYIRNLCSFYGLEGPTVDQLVAKNGDIKHKGNTVPKEIIEQIGSTATYNQNEEKKLMRIVVAGGAVLALVVIGIIGLIIWFLIPGEKSSSVSEQDSAVETVQSVQQGKADEVLFNQLTAPETPEFRTLPVPAGR